MDFILNLAIQSFEQVVQAFLHNWPYLLLSVIIAVLLRLYLNADKVSAFLNRHRGAGVLAATVAAVATPLCSCGTTAVMLGMLASTMPWAPIVAFMVASPLTSPEGLVYSAGLFGWPFAIAFYLASIVLGLAGGWITARLESRGWLANQNRYIKDAPANCACGTANQALPATGRIFQLELPVVQLTPVGQSCSCSAAAPEAALPACACEAAPLAPAQLLPLATAGQPATQKPKVTLRSFTSGMLNDGRRLLAMFAGFAFIGYFLNGLIPAGWVGAAFGGGHIYNVPLAATLGLPFYINSEASLPLVRALFDAGMSPGSGLAFLIAGSGTSIGAITGALAIARWRVVALVVAILWAGAIFSGLVFDLVLRLI